MMAPIMESLENEYKGRAAIVFIDVWENRKQGQRFVNALFGKNGGFICCNYFCSVKPIKEEKTFILSVYSFHMHKLRIL